MLGTESSRSGTEHVYPRGVESGLNCLGPLCFLESWTQAFICFGQIKGIPNMVLFLYCTARETQYLIKCVTCISVLMFSLVK